MSALLEDRGRARYTVLTADCGIDACYVANGDTDLGDVLVLSPHQTFENAVAAIQRVLPEVSADQASRIARDNLPNLRLDFDRVLEGHSERWITEVEHREAPTTRLLIVLAAAAMIVLMLVAMVEAIEHSSPAPSWAGAAR